MSDPKLFSASQNSFGCFTFLYFFSHWFEVGGAQFEKYDVAYVYSPMRISQHLNQNLVSISGLFVYCQSELIKPNPPFDFFQF